MVGERVGASGIFDSGERQDQREGRKENGTQDSGNSTLRQARNDQGTIEVVQQMEGEWTLMGTRQGVVAARGGQVDEDSVAYQCNGALYFVKVQRTRHTLYRL